MLLINGIIIIINKKKENFSRRSDITRIIPVLAGPFLARCRLIERCRSPRRSRDSETLNLSLGRSSYDS